MPAHFFDTSALTKHYQVEVGTSVVDGLLELPGSRQYVSRLTAVEINSAFAKKVRTGLLTQRDFGTLSQRFRADARAKLFEVVPMRAASFRTAERLINTHGLTTNLRTLDALQLAVALGLDDPARPAVFVCADQALCAIAAAEGLSVVNPESP